MMVLQEKCYFIRKGLFVLINKQNITDETIDSMGLLKSYFHGLCEYSFACCGILLNKC